jgi:hypothetical protein
MSHGATSDISACAIATVLVNSKMAEAAYLFCAAARTSPHHRRDVRARRDHGAAT